MLSYRETLHTTWGALFVGFIVGVALYGITTTQTYIYYKYDNRDSLRFKYLISLLWTTNTLYVMLASYAAYAFLIHDHGNLIAINMVWILGVTAATDAVTSLLIRAVFLMRVWKLSGNKVLSLCIAALDLAIFGASITYTIDVITSGTLTGEPKLSWNLHFFLFAGFLGDIITSVSLCAYLYRGHTGFKSTDTLLAILIIYTVNTGVITSICGLAAFILYSVMPHRYVFTAFVMIGSGLHLNALLASLNSRASLREKLRITAEQQ